MSVQIRRAGMEAIAEMAVLFNNYRTFYRQPADINAAREFLTMRMQQNESVVFIAYDDEAAVGFVQLYPIFSSVSLKKAWLLNDLYVEPGNRNKGIATGLLEAAKQLGRESSSKWLILQTAQRNFTAQKLYEKNGWSRETDQFFRFDL